jgi:hypothetical protein
MDPVIAATLLPFIVGGALGVWALVLMYLERRDARRRPRP